LREGAFSKQPAKQVGNPEGHKKSISHFPGPEQMRKYNVAGETKQSGKHGIASDFQYTAQWVFTHKRTKEDGSIPE
jgi:hypothetical protein